MCVFAAQDAAAFMMVLRILSVRKTYLKKTLSLVLGKEDSWPGDDFDDDVLSRNKDFYAKLF